METDVNREISRQNRRENRNVALLVTGLLGALGTGTVLTKHSQDDRGRETCEALSRGADMSDEAHLFSSETSLNAQVANCEDDHGILVDRACAATAILKTIDSGGEVPRPLIEDARAETGECRPK